MNGVNHRVRDETPVNAEWSYSTVFDCYGNESVGIEPRDWMFRPNEPVDIIERGGHDEFEGH